MGRKMGERDNRDIPTLYSGSGVRVHQAPIAHPTVGPMKNTISNHIKGTQASHMKPSPTPKICFPTTSRTATTSGSIRPTTCYLISLYPGGRKRRVLRRNVSGSCLRSMGRAVIRDVEPTVEQDQKSQASEKYVVYQKPHQAVDTIQW